MLRIERIERRYYIRGANEETYPLRTEFKSRGFKWDKEQKAWWVSRQKSDVALQFIADFQGSSGQEQGGEQTEEGKQANTAIPDSTVIKGKAKYKGRTYLLLYHGPTRKGTLASKLSSMDGTMSFWADFTEVQIVKEYPEREYRGRRTPGMTFGRLKQLREDYRQEKLSEKALGANDGLVGERTSLSTQFQATKYQKSPGCEVGDLRWLRWARRDGSHQRIATVVAGYELASYLSAEDAEDLGQNAGWWGVLFYKPATEEQFNALQQKEPREDGVFLQKEEEV